MKIAIIIPIYNQADYLQHCLDSLLNQTDGDFTVYCVNDGSTDNSQEIIDAGVYPFFERQNASHPDK